MVTFEVNDMTCNHCVGAITEAVASIDPNAKVQIDLASHRVQIESAASTTAALTASIETAGYTPVTVDEATPMAATAPARKGCCCG
ncbi:hypothetical protein BH11PSE8_BH11PSE8_22670 [soil metagenome]